MPASIYCVACRRELFWEIVRFREALRAQLALEDKYAMIARGPNKHGGGLG